MRQWLVDDGGSDGNKVDVVFNCDVICFSYTPAGSWWPMLPLPPPGMLAWEQEMREEGLENR